ncbi:MAG: hypothetical protein RJA57_484, partial [Bacteroidota bacterium]
ITLNTLSPELRDRVREQANKDFSASDAIMGRCICTSVSLLWTEEQLTEKGTRIADTVRKVLKDAAA